MLTAFSHYQYLFQLPPPLLAVSRSSLQSIQYIKKIFLLFFQRKIKRCALVLTVAKLRYLLQKFTRLLFNFSVLVMKAESNVVMETYFHYSKTYKYAAFISTSLSHMLLGCLILSLMVERLERLSGGSGSGRCQWMKIKYMKVPITPPISGATRGIQNQQL